MGLAIRPGGASWSYSGFNLFRRELAREEGLTLSEMVGFGGEREWHTSAGDDITPLRPLLNHSDCDGYLDSYECEQVLPRLRTIIDRWDADTSINPGRDYDVQQARELIAAMEHSVDHGCAVVFG